MLSPPPFTARTFRNEQGYDELVLVRDIPFTSLCEHHRLPFIGVAHLDYLPGKRILGCRSWPGSFELYARRLQLQERLTAQIAEWLCVELSPRGVGVVVEAEHMCISVSGVRAPGPRTTPSASLGARAGPCGARPLLLHGVTPPRCSGRWPGWQPSRPGRRTTALKFRQELAQVAAGHPYPLRVRRQGERQRDLHQMRQQVVGPAF